METTTKLAKELQVGDKVIAGKALEHHRVLSIKATPHTTYFRVYNLHSKREIVHAWGPEWPIQMAV